MRSRTVIAFLLAPISFGVFAAVLLSFSGTIGAVVLGMTVITGYPIALFIGFPTYLLLQRVGANGARTYALIGVVAAVVLIAIFVVLPVHTENGGDLSSLLLAERLRQMGLLTFGGVFTIAVFWFIARPDQAQDS